MKLKSFDGNLINDGTNYTTVIISWPGFPEVSYKSSERPYAMPMLGTLSYRGLSVTIQVAIEDVDNEVTLRKQLSKWFDPRLGVSKELAVTDDNGTNERVILARAKKMVPQRQSGRRWWAITLEIDGAGDIDGRFRAKTATTDTWTITGDGDTEVVNNGGGDDAFPILKIKPTLAKTGYTYRRWCPVRWKVHEDCRKYPVDIVGAGLSTASLISGAKMQSDGDDLRVQINGVEAERWIGNLNTATSRVWVTLDWQAKVEIPLRDAIASSGSVSAIYFDSVYADLVDQLPDEGILMIDSEAFNYTWKSSGSNSVHGVTRATHETSMAAHSVGATVWLVQHDIWLIYGNSSATAPTQTDDLKPLFNLDSSTNTSWVFANFVDQSQLRPGQWSVHGKTGRVYHYGGNHGASASLHSELGLGVLKQWGQTASPIYAARRFAQNVVGITNVNFTNGEMYATDKTTWYGAIDTEQQRFHYTAFEEVAALTAPTVDETWQSWSKNQALSSFVDWAGNTRYPLSVALRLVVTYNGDDLFQAFIEASDVTLTLDSTYAPTVTLGSEIGSGVYSLDATITNNTTGDAISVKFVLKLNEQLEIDTDLKTVTYLADGSNQFSALVIEGGIRRDWLPLVPGNNTLQFDEATASGLVIDLEWTERTYE
jgi:hypothetical protein